MYTTDENYINRHVTIHRAECKQIAKRGGMHKDSRARYVGHKTYRDAELYAKLIYFQIPGRARACST